MKILKEIDRRLIALSQNPVTSGVETGIMVALAGVAYILYFHQSLTLGPIGGFCFFGLFVGVIWGLIQFMGRKIFKPAHWMAESITGLGLGWLAYLLCQGAGDPMSIWAFSMAAVPIAVSIGNYLVAPAVWTFGRWLTRTIFRLH